MVILKRSVIDAKWVEIVDETGVIEEVEVRFALRRFPKKFASADEARSWIFDMERKLAKITAYRLLGMRNYSSHMLLSKLIHKGYSRAIAEGIIDELKTLGYLQDDEMIAAFIKREFHRGYGPRVIEMKLRAKGLATTSLSSCITDSMQRTKIRELKQKWGAKMSAQKLIRRGFDLQLAFEV